MEVVSSASTSFSPSMLLSVASSGGVGGNRRVSRLLARVARAVLRGVLTFFFAMLGMVLGALTGVLIWLATESGLVHSADIGAISGAVVSTEVVDSSVTIWCSHDSGIWVGLVAAGE
jgi:hypothetical protein